MQNPDLERAEVRDTEARSEDRAPYVVAKADAAAQSLEDQQACISRALLILAARVKRGHVLTSSADVRNWLRLELGECEREVFGILTLDCRNRYIDRHDLFYGSVDRASIYPREIVKACLADNAGAVVLFHNHPSGVSEPSVSDGSITRQVQDVLEHLDVRVLDHFVVSGEGSTSMKERGLM